MAEFDSTYVQDGIGTVRISEDALASIAALAATEVEGVAGMVGNLTNELIAKLGVKNLSRGVQVSITEGSICITLSLILAYGYSIPKVSREVQDRVTSMTESMTGLKVSEVIVNIAGINTVSH